LFKDLKEGRLPLSEAEFRELLGAWEGYRIGLVRRLAITQWRPRSEVWIELLPLPGPMVCSGCGGPAKTVHEVEERWVRDLALLDADTRLLVHRRRVACPTCGPKLERLSWLEPYARVTRRLAESVARMCRVLPVRHVADYFGLGWDTVRAIDHAWLERHLEPLALEPVEAILMDEFALSKGHRYATVVVDPQRKRVLWVGHGRSRESVRPFFELLGNEGRQRLRAVGMDMTAAYEQEVRLHCPQAQIVYDLFHVVAKYGREVIDRVRVDEANRLHHDRSARRLVKGARWLLLRNPDNVPQADRLRLSELLAANKALFVVYVLRDDLKQLWHYRQAHAAARFWASWYRRAIRSRISPLVTFARRLKPYLPGILAHARWPLHTSLLEGINNKIKVLKRMAYGFRDHDYFFLKIRAAFPGIAG
jgi:transposase